MTSDDFIQRLESYLDEYEGPTPMPETVRQAVRAAIPKTKQVRSLRGPTRYLNMSFTKAAQIGLAAAAAVLVVAAGAFVLSGQNVGGPDESTPSPTVVASTAPTASTTAEACERTTVGRSQGQGTMAVAWCAYGPGDPRQVAFTMDGRTSWTDLFFPGSGTLWIRPSEGGAITLAIRQGESVEDVLADVTAREGYVVANETPVDVDGAEGVSVQISLDDATSANDAPPLVADADQTWRMQKGAVTTLWVLDLGGDALMIAVGDELADAFTEALATLQWER